MAGEQADLSFSAWVEGIFDHPVDEASLMFDPEADADREDKTGGVKAERLAEYIARLFENSRRPLARFNVWQVGAGLAYIARHCLEKALRDSVPVATQERWLRAVYTIVRDQPAAEELRHARTSLIRFSAFARAACSPLYTHLRPAVLETLQAILGLDQEAQAVALATLDAVWEFAPAEVERITGGYRARLAEPPERCLRQIEGNPSLSDPPPRPTPLSFAEWTTYVFDHPVNEDEHWYTRNDRDEEPDWWMPDGKLVAEYLALVFEQPGILIQRYTEVQINRGFWYLLSGSTYRCHSAAALDDSVPIELQRRWISAVYPLFRDLLAPHTAVNFGHAQDTSPEPERPLNSACYMWWDLGKPLDLYKLASSIWYKHLVEPIFDVLEKTLALDSPACQEAALHGLGHSVQDGVHAERAKRLIERHRARVHPDLDEYAGAALIGRVL